MTFAREPAEISRQNIVFIMLRGSAALL